jgi:hypothetical protein
MPLIVRPVGSTEGKEVSIPNRYTRGIQVTELLADGSVSMYCGPVWLTVEKKGEVTGLASGLNLPDKV